MQISKVKLNNSLIKEINRMWFQLMVDINNVEEAEKMFSDLFTETELSVMTKRVAIAYWLSKGRSYENIRNNLKVSSATIASVQQQMKLPGWKLAVKKMVAEEWATKMEEKIKNLISMKRQDK